MSAQRRGEAPEGKRGRRKGKLDDIHELNTCTLPVLLPVTTAIGQCRAQVQGPGQGRERGGRGGAFAFVLLTAFARRSRSLETAINGPEMRRLNRPRSHGDT